jgi:hypothetical protein
VAAFMKEPAAINTQIVALGVDAYLKMLLTDNFVHTDLHPGEGLAGLSRVWQAWWLGFSVPGWSTGTTKYWGTCLVCMLFMKPSPGEQQREGQAMPAAPQRMHE